MSIFVSEILMAQIKRNQLADDGFVVDSCIVMMETLKVIIKDEWVKLIKNKEQFDTEEQIDRSVQRR